MSPELPNSLNEKILINIDGMLQPREEAKVSVFDNVVQGGDAVWEGLRIYDGKVFMLEEHLDRMMDSAKAMALSEVPTRDFIKEQIFATLRTNEMYDEAHIRLTLTRVIGDRRPGRTTVDFIKWYQQLTKGKGVPIPRA